MTEINTIKNDENAKEANIKQLFDLFNRGDFSALQASVKENRRGVDNILNSVRERMRALKERLLEEAEEQQRRFEEEKKEAEEESQKSAVLEAPVVLESTVKAEDKKPKPKQEPVVQNIRTKQFDTTQKPQYIRGTFTPQPEPQFVKRQQRPAGQSGQGGFIRPNAPTGAGRVSGKPILGKPDLPLSALPVARKPYDNKKKNLSPEEKKAMNKRTLIRKGFLIDGLDDDERMGTRKLRNKKPKDEFKFVPIKIEKAVITTENLTVKILSEKIGKTAQEIIKQLMVLGVMTTINSVVDFPTMELVASELGVKLELKLDKTKEEILKEVASKTDDDENLVKRPPVIAVMGHVDHGKTSLLDKIRIASVASGEAGGITQHIGAYSVSVKGEKITFLDTPGHEAFTAMRARGAMVTDIAIIVVAADDGVMPQTVEAINHVKAANVPMIVAINKIDKPQANQQKIKQALTEHGVVTDEWGGDTIMVGVSAKSGEGIDKLLESILFMAEYQGLKANPNRTASGVIIESRVDKGKGPVATLIVQNGTLRVGDTVVTGLTAGKIRAMTDDKGKAVKAATPSMAVSILGLSDVPNAGDSLQAVSDEKLIKQVISERSDKIKSEQAALVQKVTLDDVFNKMNETRRKEFNIIVKADVQGSAEALKESLLRLSTDEVKVGVVHSGVGAINKSDLMLAGVSKASIVCFNVKPDSEIKNEAEKSGISIKTYKIIYDAIDDVTAAVKGLTAPKMREEISGRAEVRNVFKITGSGVIAGCYVLSGKINRNSSARVLRDGKELFDGNISSLKRFKEDVKEVGVTYECGIGINGFSEFVNGDVIETYENIVIK